MTWQIICNHLYENKIKIITTGLKRPKYKTPNK